MAAKVLLIALLPLAFFSSIMASDPSQLQDFCVADLQSKVFVNGFVCKNAMDVTADDFSASGLNMPGDTDNNLASKVTALTVTNITGLNTLGISLARIDFGPFGLNPPHIHPRATEFIIVVEGELEVGFVTSNMGSVNKLFAKSLRAGDVFVFPQGLIHFQFNRAHANAVAFAGLSSQNPGVIPIAKSLFGATPPISDDVLAKAFQLDKKTVDWLQAQFWTENN